MVSLLILCTVKLFKVKYVYSLKLGIERYGYGHFNEILDDPEFYQHVCIFKSCWFKTLHIFSQLMNRCSFDLKDKARNLVKNGIIVLEWKSIIVVERNTRNCLITIIWIVLRSYITCKTKTKSSFNSYDAF